MGVLAPGGVHDQHVRAARLGGLQGIKRHCRRIRAGLLRDDGNIGAFPQVLSCSTAAARKVSAAASITWWPSCFRRFASFATEVVLPVPLTPTAMITNGLRAGSMASGCSQG